MASTLNNLLVAVSAALGLAFAMAHPLVTAIGIEAIVLYEKTPKVSTEGKKLEEESPSPAQSTTTSEIDNLKTRLKRAELDAHIMETELGATKASNIALDSEVAALRSALKTQADGFRERMWVQHEEADALKGQVYDAKERRKKALRAAATARKVAEGEKTLRIQAEAAVEHQRGHARRVENKLLALSIAWSYSEHSVAILASPPSLSISPSTDIGVLHTALTEATHQLEVQTDRAELSEQALQAFLDVNAQVGARMEALERMLVKPRTGTSQVFSVRDHHAASPFIPITLSTCHSVVSSLLIPPQMISSWSLPKVSMHPTSPLILSSILIPMLASTPAYPLLPTSPPCLLPSTLYFHSKFASKFSASAPYPLLYLSHETAYPSAPSLFSHVHHLDEPITVLEPKARMLEYTLERLEGHLGDQLSSAMQLSETTCAIGQETASNVEEIKIIKRVTFKRLGGEELENVEYIADRKSTHAYVDTPQVVLTQPEGGTVRGVDKISRLISTRNSFYSPISTSTFSGLVGAKHLAISNVSIFSKFEPLVDDEPLPKFWTDYPSTHGVILRSPANSLSKSNINKCAQEEKAIENQLERSMCVPDNMASPSLSLENDDTELPEDEGSPSSSTTLSPTSLFTTPTSSPSSSPPTSPSITSVACPEDDEHSSMRTYKSRLPSFLSSCRSLFAVPSSMPTFGRDVEFQTPAFDDVDWFAGMASASWSEGGCWQLP